MMRSSQTSLCALALLAGCTLTTDSGDRVITERLDLDFTLFAMFPHRGAQLDVALVHPVDPSLGIPPSNELPNPARQYQLRARARILVPAEPSESLFPPISVLLPGVVTNEPLQVLFYVDTELNNKVEPLTPELKPFEHTWVKPVPETGELTFTHQFDFQAFYDSEIVGSTDIVLEVPTGVSAAATACLNQQVTTIAKKTIDVRIVFNFRESPRVVGYFKMYTTNTLPTLPIKLVGIADNQSVYLISPAIDGVPTRSSPSSPVTDTGLSIPFEQWFPIDHDVLLGCLAM